MFLRIAAALFVLLVIAHSYLGERYILIRLFRRDNLPRIGATANFTKFTLRLAWHITSVMGLGFAALLVVEPTTLTVAQIISLTSAGCGLVSLAISRGRHPSWIVFFAIAALSWQ